MLQHHTTSAPAIPVSPQPALDQHIRQQLEALVVQALTQGGDARIELGSDGANQYACAPRPDAHLVALGSSTASVISEHGFQAAIDLAARLCAQPQSFRAEVERQRGEILQLSGAAHVAGAQAILAASGTDIHLIATHLVAGTGTLQTVMVEASETGSGVPAAVSALHFASKTAQGHVVDKGSAVSTLRIHSPLGVRLRQADGQPRDGAAIDADFSAQVQQVLESGARCLLVMTDLTKTGMQAPSLACAQALQARYAGRLYVLVDACQFRLAPASIAHYLEQGFMVAITGSKFVSGPAFSGALLLPPARVRGARSRSLHALRHYASRLDWPQDWNTAKTLDEQPNLGLLLRWEAALAELRRLHAIPESFVRTFVQRWGEAVRSHIAHHPLLQALPVPALQRQGTPGWDSLQTIFPVLLRCPQGGTGSRYVRSDEAAQLYRLMGQGAERFQLGQPVACGQRDGAQLAALRLCCSARMVAAAWEAGDAQAEGAVAQTLRAFDKLATLVRQLGQ